VYLDRDDSRRKQLEADVLAKVVLARPDVEIRMPLDDTAALEATRDEGYGRTVLRVGAGTRETRSTSRKQIVTLLFESTGRNLPDYSQAVCPGYPPVIDGFRRRALGVTAYILLPIGLLAVGFALSRGRSER